MIKKYGKITLTTSEKTIKIDIGENEFFAEYQTDINLLGVPEGHFDLLMYILFYDLEKIDLTKTEIITFGTKSIVSFSGGADSTALLSAFGGIPVHINRSYSPDYEEKQLRAVNNVKAINIRTDFEKIRMLYGKTQGFNVGIGYACLYMPLISSIGANKIMFGVVFDDLAFNYGNPFSYNANFENTKLFKIRKEMNRFGIDFVLPLAGYSEVLTVQIAAKSGVKQYSSCHVIGEASECLQCIKCFRKIGSQGVQIDIEQPLLKKRLHKLLTTYPLKMAAVTVYAIQKANYNFPKWKNIDVSFCERVNRNMTIAFYKDEKLDGFEWQTEEDIKNIKKFVEFINNKKNYE